MKGNNPKYKEEKKRYQCSPNSFFQKKKKNKKKEEYQAGDTNKNEWNGKTVGNN
jgi:hypothetical protein